MRKLVLPGELLSTTLKGGRYTYTEGANVYSAILGLEDIRGDYVDVIPLGGRYIPRAGEYVIGEIINFTPTAWVVDVNSIVPAVLPANETPWNTRDGVLTRYLKVHDVALMKVIDVDEVKRTQLTMRDRMCRKLLGGLVVEIEPTRVPRVIGRKGSMLTLLKDLTRCRIYVGQNGRVWIDGENMELVVKALERIEREAHLEGLTDAIARDLRRELQTSGSGE
jgi:exosome complex component RRP4